MTDIRREAKLCGKKSCISGTAIIDTGSPISVVNKTTANVLGCKSTGKKGHFMTIDGKKVSGDLVECDIDLKDTCCKNKINVLAVNDNLVNLVKPKEILLGKNYTEKVGMEIDEKKKDEYNISCDCSKLISQMYDEQQNKFKKTKI